MASYKTDVFQKSLKKKGFKEVNDSHHIYYYFVWKGKLTEIKTYVSHGKEDFNDYLFNRRKKQIKIKQNKEMLRFYNCPMTQEEYTNYLISNKEIEE